MSSSQRSVAITRTMRLIAAFISSTKVHIIGIEQVWKHLRSKMTKGQVGPVIMHWQANSRQDTQ